MSVDFPARRFYPATVNPLSIRLPRGWGLATPPVAFLLFFFVLPAITLFVTSFFAAQAFQIVPDWNVGNYLRIFKAAGFWKANFQGLTNGFFVATISVLLAFPAAFYVVYRAKTNLILYMALLSWFSSYLVRIFAWRTILGTNGMVNSALINLGLIDAPLDFLIFSPTAAIITLVHIMVPFALLILVSALQDVKAEYLEAARDLGATRWQVLTRVILPMCHKGLVGAFMFSFILAAGDFIIPQLMGGRDGITSGLLISGQFRSVGNWPLGSAMAWTLMSCLLIVYLLFVGLLYVARLSPGRRYH
ncbi:MAG: ABC transporter permease [Rhizobiales bacterium]|nr:ABC transporter permease [Hyphomicrobiales bacterium]MBA70688.1 ABC transporter permease [Hyphomicrobiales bacterium]|tara:strand:- start:57 stop:968 length:912 start_codon:yes stop_codon:yes gene_type:complete